MVYPVWVGLDEQLTIVQPDRGVHAPLAWQVKTAAVPV